MPPTAAGFGYHQKLHTSREFSAVFSCKKRIFSRCFTIHLAPNKLPHSRLGLTVSRRVSKKAVERNKIKRAIRETFRVRVTNLGALDFVVVARPAAEKQHQAVLQKELEKLWLKAEKMRPESSPR